MKPFLLFMGITMISIGCTISKITGLNTDAPPAAVINPEKDGGSIECAVPVGSVLEEYNYVRAVCPTCVFLSHRIVKNGKKLYDLLTYYKDDKTQQSWYFDINSFFWKNLAGKIALQLLSKFLR